MEPQIQQLIADIQNQARDIYQQGGDLRARFVREELSSDGTESFRAQLNEIYEHNKSAAATLLEMQRLPKEEPPEVPVIQNDPSAPGQQAEENTTSDE